MHSLVRRSPQLRKFFVKHCISASTTTTEVAKAKSPYDEFIDNRQQEATRSVVVQVSSEKSCTELYNYCSNFGSIVGAHHYRIPHDDDQHYILLEFASAQEAAAAIDSSAYNDELSGVSARSPFLWFKAASKRALQAKASNVPADHLCVLDGTHTLSSEELHTLLRAAPSIEQQINVLHQSTQLNDLGVRLRFLAALQLQQAVSGMFPGANAQPFGSSVNGFGKMGCDLDLILRLDREPPSALAKQRLESRLVFHTKENLANGRSQTQRQMESIGDMLQLFLPGVCHVRRILQARVPIIKYHHEHLDLEVDLSMSNLSGFYMSELLYMFGELDARVRPLTFCIRRWASACGLTNPSPGRWISNFSLTCLVMFFLQQLKQPLLPSIGALIKAAMPADVRLTEDGINCTFGRNFEHIGFRSRNTSQLSELLLQFYEFYSQFDFSNRAISLNEGRAIAKPDHAAMYIVNPLEQMLNVSKNVSLEECERLRIEVRNAAWLLESELEGTALTPSEQLEAPWGLLNLFKTPEKSIIRPNLFFKPRMVEVSDLFEKSKAQAAAPAQNTHTPAPTPVDYKNATVKQQVQTIKAQARSDLKQMRLQATAGTTTTTTTSVTTPAVTGSAAKSRRRSR